MLIGLTYDLRQDYLDRGFSLEEVAEFDSPETIAALESTLASLGHRVVRIGSLPALVDALSRGERWDLVFNIAEGRGGFGREAQVPALLDYYGVPYTFSDPLTLSLTLHKGMAKRVVRDAGLATPDFTVIEYTGQVQGLDMVFPLFAKPVAEGTGRGIGPGSKISSQRQLVQVCEELLRSHGQPVLVESFLPGREFTVGLVGTGPEARAIATMEVVLRPGADAEVYSLKNKELCEQFVDYHLVTGPDARRAEELSLAAWRVLGCRDAGRVDLRCDAGGRPHFLEVNPLAGLHPHHSDLPILCGLAGVSFSDLLERILVSAVRRHPRLAHGETLAAGLAAPAGAALGMDARQ